MELFVTEHKNACRENRHMNTVRVFLQKNYDYGLWIAEDFLYNLLSIDQKKQYSTGTDYQSGIFDIDFDTASKILDKGKTPFNKQKLYKDV